MKIEFKTDVYLTLTLQEAAIIRAALAVTGGTAGYEVYSKLDDFLDRHGDINDVGDLLVPSGNMIPAREV